MTTTKLPETLARINAEIHARHVVGLSTDVVDMDSRPLVDDHVGVFIRYWFTFADGDRLTFDSQEMSPQLRKALQEKALQ